MFGNLVANWYMDNLSTVSRTKVRKRGKNREDDQIAKKLKI
jgi:hypothetical protein